MFRYITCLILCNWLHNSLSTSSSCTRNNCVFTCTNIPEFGAILDINLSSLDNLDNSPRFTNIQDVKGTYTYSWNPCQPFTSGSCTNVNVCQKLGNKEYDAGEQPRLLYKQQEKEFYLEYSSTSSDQTKRVTKVKLVYKNGEEGKVSKVTENPQNFYTLTLYTKYAPHHGSRSSGGGISTGTVLVIVFFCILVLYFGIGIAFLRHRRGAQGKDMIPNYTFWSKLPGLIKDGCIFSFTNLKKCTSSVKEKTGEKKNNEYEKI